jgi:hypothetical protein
MTRQAMMHFVINLKSYLMFEVLEGEWKDLLQAVHQAGTLDEAIQSHDNYIEGVCRKSLLIGSTDGNSGPCLSAQVNALISLANEFCNYQEELFGTAIEAVERAAEKRLVAELRLKEGQWGFIAEKERVEEGTLFGLADGEHLVELDRISVAFRRNVVAFLHSLDAKLNGGMVLHDEEPATPGTPSKDGDTAFSGPDLYSQGDLSALRFLHFQLDCNQFYSNLAK